MFLLAFIFTFAIGVFNSNDMILIASGLFAIAAAIELSKKG